MNPPAGGRALSRSASVCERSVVAATIIALAGCHHSIPGVQPAVHYVVGAPYRADGVWRYPREAFSFQDTGLATVDRSTTRPHLTADGEVYDPNAMAGSHPTLQLPVDVVVRNLDNGREITVRLNDRGPEQRGRLVSLTPRAAAALGMGAGPVRVEIEEIEAASRGYAESLPGGPMLALTAAPVAFVTQQDLGPPESGRSPVSPNGVTAGTANTAESARPAITALPSLPATYRQGVPRAGNLWIETGRFTLRTYAAMEAARAGGTVWPNISGRGPAWIVRAGPFSLVDDADAALDRALAAGLTGAHIVVE